ncbi:hypothetical protein HZI73_06995 [Vallitalea pronyensis]|uniref:Uncharacterized protein n=1 Tax=Vallitalea pronyensis TaxID=1348613 RepID=A0A8J8SFY4_9FIRM|nr:hypothetical protein [Vallitalea pronyensis]QUI22061.1 hypothetical protein HZI73_06995 [Vallitalea pronyensis]
MHLIRLLITGIEILERGRIKTYRKTEKDLLMAIRLGKYSYKDIYKMVDEYEVKFREAARKTKLPDNPDESKAEKLLIDMYSMYY